MYTIRFCDIDEYQILVDFIKNHWREDHIFVKNKDILDWQYLDMGENRYNFVVAFNHQTAEFDAVLGFIPTSHFDKTLVEHKELWLALWRVKDSATNNVSGMNLLHFLRNKLKPVSIYAIGISDITKNIYRVLGYEVAKMRHFYIPNTHKENFKIAKFPLIESKIIDTASHLYKIHSINWLQYKDEISVLLDSLDVKPKKSVLYFENRYVYHHWLNYQYLGVFKDGKLCSVIIFRVVEVLDSCCLRIMDWIGNFVDENLYLNMQDILNEFEAEYIDFVCYVPNKSYVTHMGFKEKNIEYCVIPEYFNPFVAENIDIFFCAKTKDHYRLVKGDSDQDRPNHL